MSDLERTGMAAPHPRQCRWVIAARRGAELRKRRQAAGNHECGAVQEVAPADRAGHVSSGNALSATAALYGCPFLASKGIKFPQEPRHNNRIQRPAASRASATARPYQPGAVRACDAA